jgi:hypothetical protein
MSLGYYMGLPQEDGLMSALGVGTWLCVSLLFVLFCAAGPGVAAADDVGQIKVARGSVVVERQGRQEPAAVGARIQATDVLRTGRDGSVGIGFRDGSLLSAGPNSVLAIDRFVFDSTTHQGAFDATLRKGTLAVISGKIAKQSPDAMKVRTPAALLGARGTEFVVRASGPGD